MNPEHKKYILENIKKKTAQEISSDLRLKERIVRRFLEKESVGQNKDLAETGEDRPQEKKVTQRKGELIISVCIIVIIVICAFLPAVKNGFVNWDDPAYVTENAFIKHVSLANIKALLTTSFVSTYQPVVNLTYLLEHHFFGLNASFYHAINILLHLLNCIFVFWLLLLLDGNIFVSLVAALLFGLHPLRVESVVWISERKDVLYSFFFLWALVNYCRYVQDNSIKYYYRSFLLFLLSLGSKAMAVTLPLAFFAIDYLLKRKFNKKIVLEKVPFFILAFLFGIIAILAQGTALKLGHGEPFMISRQLFVPFYGIIMYLYKTVFPVNLSLIYMYPPQNASFYLICLASIILTFSLVATMYFSIKFTRKASFGLFFALITVLPVLQFIPVGTAIMADRYTYLPSIGICYIVSAGFFYLYRMKRRYMLLQKVAQAILLIGIITALFFLTYNRTQLWKDSITIFSDVIKKYPDAYMAYYNRGLAYADKGSHDQAISDYNRAIQIRPDYAEAYSDRGIAYKIKGNYDQAILDYTKAIELNPGYAQAYYNRGIAYGNKDNYNQAILDYTKAIELKPNYADAYNNQGTAYFNRGNYSKAILNYTRAIELNPDFAGAYQNRGLAYASKGNYNRAISEYNKAIQIKPDFATAYVNRAVAYYYIKEFDKAWTDVDKAELLGYKVGSQLIEVLKKASGREK